jgi:hypothetical protein
VAAEATLFGAGRAAIEAAARAIRGARWTIGLLARAVPVFYLLGRGVDSTPQRRDWATVSGG